MMTLDNFHGLWWPKCDDDSTYRLKKIHDAKIAVEILMTRLRNRGTVVQAGGHVGCWPLMLSQYVSRVYTFEPDAANFACLARNVDHEKVFAVRGALRDTPTPVSLISGHKPNRSGFWTVDGEGDIPAYCLDQFGLSGVDAIVLDVEGSEFAALRGAHDTIHKYHPLIVVEATDLRLTDTVTHLLGTLGYSSPQPFFKRDIIYAPVR